MFTQWRKKMNIYDISKKAGVSIATISRVINGSTKVSPKTRAKVLAAIEETGYTPNAFARGLGLDSMRTIGILCADASDIYLANAIYILESELRSQGYNSILCCTGYALDKKQRDLKLLISKRIDAIVMIGSNYVENDDKDNHYIIEAAKKIPIMIINGYLDATNVYCCLADDYQATFDITKKLMEKNNKYFLYLYRSESYSGKKKLSGFRDAFDNCHHCDHRELKCDGNITDIITHIDLIKQSFPTIEAIICSDDEIAVGALKWAKKNRINVPAKLSVIGFNNSKYATLSTPELTSIDNHSDSLCKNAVDSLMRVFNGENIPKKLMLSTDLVIRETTK